MSRLRRYATAALLLGLGYFVYEHGLWEPLRTGVVVALGGLFAVAAFLAHRRASRAQPSERGYLALALAATAVVTWKLTAVLPMVGWEAGAPVLVGVSTAAAVTGVALQWQALRRDRLLRGPQEARLRS